MRYIKQDKLLRAAELCSHLRQTLDKGFLSGRVLVVEDTPIRRLRSFEVPAPYPRTRACLTEPRMLELRESLISLLRREVSE